MSLKYRSLTYKNVSMQHFCDISNDFFHQLILLLSTFACVNTKGVDEKFHFRTWSATTKE